MTLRQIHVEARFTRVLKKKKQQIYSMGVEMIKKYQDASSTSRPVTVVIAVVSNKRTYTLF